MASSQLLGDQFLFVEQPVAVLGKAHRIAAGGQRDFLGLPGNLRSCVKAACQEIVGFGAQFDLRRRVVQEVQGDGHVLIGGLPLFAVDEATLLRHSSALPEGPNQLRGEPLGNHVFHVHREVAESQAFDEFVNLGS